MTDPRLHRDIGRLESRVAALEARLAEANRTQAQMAATLSTISATLAEARGGWRALLGLAGMAAAAGGLVTGAVAWLLQR